MNDALTLITDRYYDAADAIPRAYAFIRNAANDAGRDDAADALTMTLTSIASAYADADALREYDRAVRDGDAYALAAIMDDSSERAEAIHETWNAFETIAADIGWTLYAPDADALLAVPFEPEPDGVHRRADGTRAYEYYDAGIRVEWNGSRTFSVHDAYTGAETYCSEWHQGQTPPGAYEADAIARSVAHDAIVGAFQ